MCEDDANNVNKKELRIWK